MLKIRQLLDPAAYPHAPPAVRLLETHISWILLTGEYGYKVKKEVDFGFLDYSTLERRHHFCQEEVRLNRRYCGELYLGVVPITRVGGVLRLGGSGPPVEYAVKMREFPQEALYDHQLREGRLDPEKLSRLGRRLALFHSQAERVGMDAAWGSAEATHQPARDNFRQLRELEPEFRLELARLALWTESEYTRLASCLEERKALGFVRELHGDLHTGNITDWQGEPTPFDGIEFDPALRYIDTMNDLAFLDSDLEHHGRADLGHRMLDAYLEETGDYSGLRLWDYYRVYRMMVRAKVAALGKKGRHQDRRTQVVSYLRQATQSLVGRRPMLVLTHGYSGSGKSYLSQILVEQGGFIRVRSDVIRKRLFGLAPRATSGSRLGEGIYGIEQTWQTYQHMATLAQEILKTGLSVVVDAAFLQKWQRDLLHDVAERQGAAFRIVSRTAPLETLRERLRQRVDDASEATLDVLNAQVSSSQPLEPDPETLTLDGDLPSPRELLRLLQAN